MRKFILISALISLGTILSVQHGLATEQTVTIHVADMTCSTCPISVRYRALQMRGVHTASVDINTALATITYEDSEQSPQAVAQAITELGYPAIVTGQTE